MVYKDKLLDVSTTCATKKWVLLTKFLANSFK